MNGQQEVTYRLDFEIRRRTKRENQEGRHPGEPLEAPVPRIARLLALAIRIEQQIQDHVFTDYAEVARRGRVTRARLTQIMRLLDLAPDIQEQILFLPPPARLNERNLRLIVKRIDWNEQRHLFQQIVGRGSR